MAHVASDVEMTRDDKCQGKKKLYFRCCRQLLRPVDPILVRSNSRTARVTCRILKAFRENNNFLIYIT